LRPNGEEREEMVPDVMLIPCGIFDLTGRRWHRGGGFYERRKMAGLPESDDWAAGLPRKPPKWTPFKCGPYDIPWRVRDRTQRHSVWGPRIGCADHGGCRLGDE